MTGRHAAYIVVLRDDIRDDEAGPTLTALRMIHGVASVEPVLFTYEMHIAWQRLDRKWREALIRLAGEGPPPV
jgi:hypothetical protein